MPDSIPAISWTRTCLKKCSKKSKNSRAPARHKAEDDYLLTTKLFCGMCGAIRQVRHGPEQGRSSLL